MIITGQDLWRLMEEYADASPDNMYELLDTWCVDAEGFKDFVITYLRTAQETYLQRKQDMDEIVMTAFCCAFVLGYKTASEVQIRREVNGNEVQGT